MKRIQIRIALLLLYVGVLGYFFYPKGLSPLEGEGLRWTLTFAGVLILLIALYLILRYRKKKRSKYEYGQYPREGRGARRKVRHTYPLNR